MLRLTLKPPCLVRLRKGYPWVYTQDIQGVKKLPFIAGELVSLLDQEGKPFAIGYYNSQSKLACRVLTFNPEQTIDTLFLKKDLPRHSRFVNNVLQNLIIVSFMAKAINCRD